MAKTPHVLDFLDDEIMEVRDAADDFRRELDEQFWEGVKGSTPPGLEDSPEERARYEQEMEAYFAANP